MTDVREEVVEYLEEDPEGEDHFRHLLEVDAEREAWEFDDIQLDSGTFGELVSRGIIEKIDGKYHLADRDEVRAALEGEEISEETTRPPLDLSIDFPPRRASLALVGSLLLVAVFRLFAYQSVFRAEHVVLLGNDPYYYRYWLFRFVEQGTSVFALPEAATVGEPLMLATLLAMTKLLGGTTDVANLVLAWYPVVAASVTAGLVYVLTVSLTEDRRVGLAAVALLAVTPVHAYRTSIGFADHHAFDFVWLAVTATAAVVLLQRASATDVTAQVRTAGTLAWVGSLGLGVAAQTLAWNAGPILLLPLAMYGVVRAAAAVEADETPLADLPLVAGIALGAVLALAVHFILGWQRLYIVITPLLLAVGFAAVLAAGEVARRRNFSGLITLAGLVGVGSLVFVVAYVALPDFAAQFTQEVVRLFFGGTGENIAETASLFSPRYGTIVGPFFFFGLSLFFVLPYLPWGIFVGWSQNRSAWLLVSSYGAVLFVLALLQVRFAGQLAVFVATFGGLAIIHLAAITGVGERPSILSESEETVHPWRSEGGEEPAFELPNRQTVVALGLIFLLVGGLGAVMTPLRTNLLTVSDESYNAATFMEDYSEQKGWEYPQNYVFSEWGDNRMYNAFVSGESRSYSYAQRNYTNFLASTNGSKWYQKLHDRAGFVVVGQYGGFENGSEELMYNRLQNWGSGTSHYRAVWASDDGSKKVFTLVPGAKVTGPAKPNTTVTLTQTVNISGQEVEYTRTVRVNEFGVFTTRLPNTGPITVGDAKATVSEQAVTEGKLVSTFSGPGIGYWSFDEGHGETAYDRVGGNHAEIHGGGWTANSVNGSALQLNGSGYAQAGLNSQNKFTVSIWIKPERLNITSGNNYRHLVAGEKGSLLVLEENGAVTFRVPGVERQGWSRGHLETGKWSHVVAVYNGTHRILYLDGERVGSQRIGSGEVNWGTWVRYGGSGSEGQPHAFDGSLDEIRVYGTALNESTVQEVYNRYSGE